MFSIEIYLKFSNQNSLKVIACLQFRVKIFVGALIIAFFVYSNEGGKLNNKPLSKVHNSGVIVFVP